MTDPHYLLALADGNHIKVETDFNFEPSHEPPDTHIHIRNEWDNELNAMFGLYALPSTADGPSIITDLDPVWILQRKTTFRWRIVSEWQPGEPPRIETP